MPKKEPLYPHVPKSKKASVSLAEERRTYYCAIEEKHPHREIVQVSTTQRDPECPYCRGIMTYGIWWPVPKAEES